jgi:ABC-type Co2+ transport system permease subunit
MPCKAYRFILLEADTRPLEFFIAGVAMLWGVWLANPLSLADVEFWRAVTLHGGPLVWSAWSFSNGLFQAFSTWYRYPKFRRWSSSLSAVMWVFASYSIMTTNAHLFSGWFTALIALGELWVVLRRAVVS